MPAETFSPIKRPFDLDPAEFVAEMTKRGLRLNCGVWYDGPLRCGCVTGIAAVLKDPSLIAKSFGPDDARRTLGLSAPFLRGLSDGLVYAQAPSGRAAKSSYGRGYAYASDVYSASRLIVHTVGSSHVFAFGRLPGASQRGV